LKIGLTDSFAIDDAAGVSRFVAVVQGAADGSCKKPAAANAAGFLGVTIEDESTQHAQVTVCTSGSVRVTAGGIITRGDRLAINSASGDVKSVEAQITAAPGAAAVVNVIGQALASAVAGDVFDMFIRPCLVSIAAS
jgi:hypothetical protein